ncbi:MAG TPA: DUF3576 domain-containing protein [Stellaceae bacterium]|jgi:hypothetical protein|nr:DUF3576 domain-containing protein [Stellaceae bacterium]
MSFRIVGCVVALAVAGCGMFGGSKSDSGDTKTVQTTDNPYHTDPGKMDPRDFNPKIQSDNDPSTLTLMSALFGGGGSGQQNNGGAAGVGVNSFLWRASLDTVSFMPLASADPFGGVIITDWFSPPETPDERFKVNVFILGRDLRADGVRASVFHQKKDAASQWAEAPVDANTATDLENAILTRARQIRLSAVANQQ